VLVATDVAARGIHVDGISLVLHVDPPRDARDYLHRAGRTARAGESGAVATLVLPRQRRAAAAMLAAAGVAPAETRVRAGDEALRTLTGARRPSGVPVPAAPEGPHRTARPHRPDGPNKGERRPDGPHQGERRPRERSARPGGDRRPYRHRDGHPRAAAGR
jgi:superfamily II DNA/RNA helicase